MARVSREEGGSAGRSAARAAPRAGAARFVQNDDKLRGQAALCAGVGERGPGRRAGARRASGTFLIACDDEPPRSLRALTASVAMAM